jgi:hypothetical protein
MTISLGTFFKGDIISFVKFQAILNGFLYK